VAEGPRGEPSLKNARCRPARLPNILILHTDQHNARVMGCAGHPDVKTPYLDRLAAEGMRFERAYCQDAICVPSRTSLMTGLYPRTTGVLWNSAGDDGQIHPGVRIEPMAAYFKSHGYRTGTFGRRHLGAKTADIGWDVTCTTADPKFEPRDNEFYYEWVRKIGQWEAFDRDMRGSEKSELTSLVSQLPPEATQEAWASRKAIDFIRKSAQDGRPFFCWVPYLHPHHPYTPLPEYYNLYDQAKLTLPANLHESIENLPPQLQAFRAGERGNWCLGRAAKDEKIFRHFLACYYGCVSQVDHYLGEILDALEKTGQADNTIVIFTSDHGDFAAYHGLVEKYPWGHNIYEETLRVPLIVRWPGHVRRGEVREDLVEETDLYPTLLELAGIKRPEGYALPGRSLVPTLTQGKALGRRFAFSENPIMVTAIGEQFKLGVWLSKQRGNYPDMLFDRRADPLEVNNLIGRPEAATAERDLRAALDAWVARTPRVAIKTPPQIGGAGWPASLRSPAGKTKTQNKPKANTPTAYYVSHSEGDDSYDGRAAARDGIHGPWKTLARASEVKLQPGDQLLLKRGDIWDETLRLTGDGTVSDPITVGSYGTGERPYIRRTLDKGEECIVLAKAAGYCFRDLELGYAQNGIHMVLDERVKRVYDGFRLENCFFHDIGNPRWPPKQYVWSAAENRKMGWALMRDGLATPRNLMVTNCISLRNQGFVPDGTKEDFRFDRNTIVHGSLNQVCQTWGRNQNICNCVFAYNYPWTYFPWGTTQVMAGQLKGGDHIRNEVINNEFGWGGDYPGAPDGCGYDFEGPTDATTFQNNFVHDTYGEAVLFMPKCAHTNLIFDNNIFRSNVRFSPIWDFDVTVGRSNTGSGTFSNNKFFLRPGKRAFNAKPACFTFVNNEENASGTFVEMPLVTHIEYREGARIYTLASATPGVTLRYTTDASLPNAASPVYTGPVKVTRSGALNVKAFKDGCYPSYVNALVVEMRGPEGRGPSAWWKLDEQLGTPVKDSAGNNHGMLVGTFRARKTLGRGLEFNGVDGVVNLQNASLADIADTFTIVFRAAPSLPRASTPEVYCGCGVTGTAWWKFDEAEGISVADSIGGNPGVLTGCEWTAGKSGHALRFNGEGDSVTLTNVSLKAVSDTFTISFWAEPEARRASTPQASSGSSGLSGQRYAFAPTQYSAATGAAGVGVSVGTNGVSVFELADNFMPSLLVADRSLAGWNQITVVYEDRQPRLYVNGVLAQTGLKSTKIVHPDFRLGGAAGLGWYQGKLDDIRVYPRVLTEQEIRQLANQRTAATVAWSLDQKAGTAGLPYALGPVSRGGGRDAGHAGAGVVVGTNGVTVCESSDDYLPSLLVDNLPVTGWNHIVVVYRNKQPTLYVNGVFEKAGYVSTKIVHPVFNLGGLDSGRFAGKLDDVRIYDRALTDAEIQELAVGK